MGRQEAEGRGQEAMEEFLRKGTFSQLGFYLYLRSQVKEGGDFSVSRLAEGLYVAAPAISLKLRQLRKLGAIETEYLGRGGLRVVKFNFDFEVVNHG